MGASLLAVAKAIYYPKMTGQNDRQDRSLTGQVHDQAGHCPLTGRYLQPCNCSKQITFIFINDVSLVG